MSADRSLRILPVLLAVTALVSACRKHEPPAPAPVPVPPTAPAPVAPPPAQSATPASSQPEAAPSEPKQGNWWSLKAPGEKQETMEGWLYQHSTGNAATKAEIVKQVQNAKLSPADKAMLEGVRTRLKLPPMPMQ